MLIEDRFNGQRYKDLKNDIIAIFEDTDVTYTEAITALRTILTIVYEKQEEAIQKRCRYQHEQLNMKEGV
ncbi:hypothetical protein [Veillonella sp.]|uniref:hypothetical protein n=1 Tax=Veillonella sp. TaxID=1926307 RepID=UPI0025CC967A|nr:hypothetical protein [Veillonella sp.]